MIRALLSMAVALGAALAQTPAPARPATPAGTQPNRTAPPPPPTPPPPVRRSAAVPSYKDLKYPTLRQIQIPKIETFTLANGMKVYLLEDHELPVVQGTALVRTGNLFDPAEKVGLAGVTGTVMRTGGTKSATGDQLDEQLEDVAASVESGIGETSGSVSFSALKENAGPVLAIFRDVLTAPEFRQNKVDLALSQLRSAIARRNDSAGAVAGREFTNIIYGPDTPYGWMEQYATIGRITRADLQNFYSRYFFPANVMLAVRGDFETAAMRSQLESLFAAWTVKQPAVPPIPKVAPRAAAGIYLAPKQDVTQTFFSIGELGGELRDKDYPALTIMADILGGGFQSRLMTRIRTQMGNAYNIGASWDANFDHPGLFQISGSTKSLSTVETIKAAQEEVERIRTAEVTEDELKSAKDSALNSLVFAFDTKAKTLSRLLTYEYFGYPLDFIQQYQKALQAVTRADVLRVAKAHLDPARFTIVAVGNPNDFGKPLNTLGGPVTTIDLTIPEPNAEAARPDQASLAKGKQILARMQQAVGGADKLAAVKDAAEVAEFDLDAAAGGAHVVESDRWIAPDRFRQESRLPQGQIQAYLGPDQSWMATPQGAGPLGGAQLKQVQGDLFRLYWRLLLSDRIEGRTVNAVDDNRVDISDRSGNRVQVAMDPDTGLPAQISYESTSLGGPPASVREELSGFRDVDGIKYPFQVTILQGGRKFADVKVTEVKVNQGLKPEDLQKRP